MAWSTIGRPHRQARASRTSAVRIVICAWVALLVAPAPAMAAERQSTPMVQSGQAAVALDSVTPPGRAGWVNVTWTISPAGPQLMRFAAYAYDSTDQYGFVFGGLGPAGPTDRCWIFDDGNWEDVTQNLTTARPPALYGAQMADDPANGYVLMFGGRTASGTLYNGTWSYANFQWTNRSGGVAPPSELGGAMAFDPSSGGVLLVDPRATTSWTYRSGHWSAQGQSPSPPRTGAVMAADPRTGSAILYGGQTLGSPPTPLSDTWVYRQGGWSRVQTSSSPPGFVDVEATYDPVTQGLFLFGSSPSTPGESWNFSNGSWSRFGGNSTAAPPARVGGVLFWDSSGAVILCGGADLRSQRLLADCWAWGLALPPPDASAHSAALSPLITEVLLLTLLVPVGVALYFALRPRRPDIARLPTPEPRPSVG